MKVKSMLVFQELSTDPGNKNIGHQRKARHKLSLTQDSGIIVYNIRKAREAELEVHAEENHLGCTSKEIKYKITCILQLIIFREGPTM